MSSIDNSKIDNSIRRNDALNTKKSDEYISDWLSSIEIKPIRFSALVDSDKQIIIDKNSNYARRIFFFCKLLRYDQLTSLTMEKCAVLFKRTETYSMFAKTKIELCHEPNWKVDWWCSFMSDLSLSLFDYSTMNINQAH